MLHCQVLGKTCKITQSFIPKLPVPEMQIRRSVINGWTEKPASVCNGYSTNVAPVPPITWKPWHCYAPTHPSPTPILNSSFAHLSLIMLKVAQKVAHMAGAIHAGRLQSKGQVGLNCVPVILWPCTAHLCNFMSTDYDIKMMHRAFELNREAYGATRFQTLF